MNIALDPTDERHGTTNGYTNHRCRCESCKAAQTAWMAHYRSTERGRAVTRLRNKESQKRTAKAAQWAYAHGYRDGAS